MGTVASQSQLDEPCPDLKQCVLPCIGIGSKGNPIHHLIKRETLLGKETLSARQKFTLQVSSVLRCNAEQP